MRWSLVVLLGCAGSAPAAEPEPVPEPVPVPTPASTTSPDKPLPRAEAGACPDDTLLVDGEYCEKLAVECLKKFYAPQNHLWVCLEVKKPTRCEGPKRHMRFCIDRYEFPNKKGVRPMVMQNFYQAQVHCE